MKKVCEVSDERLNKDECIAGVFDKDTKTWVRKGGHDCPWWGLCWK